MDAKRRRALAEAVHSLQEAIISHREGVTARENDLLSTTVLDVLKRSLPLRHGRIFPIRGREISPEAVPAIQVAALGHQQENPIRVLVDHPWHGTACRVANRIAPIARIINQLARIRQHLARQWVVHSCRDPFPPGPSHANRKCSIRALPSIRNIRATLQDLRSAYNGPLAATAAVIHVPPQTLRNLCIRPPTSEKA